MSSFSIVVIPFRSQGKFFVLIAQEGFPDQSRGASLQSGVFLSEGHHDFKSILTTLAQGSFYEIARVIASQIPVYFFYYLIQCKST